MGKKPRTKRVRVAMVGAFDMANLADLLFPALAVHELERRLADVKVDLFACNALATPAWPYRVRALSDLPTRIASYDLLLIGGGHLVRSDKTNAPGYLPSDPAVHHPLGFWLVPALLAAAAGVPVAFNAVGASAELAPWSHPLVRAALDAAAYVAVRDHASARTLARIAPDVAVHVVPDTAFGLDALISDAQPSSNGHRPRTETRPPLGDRRYVVLQPTGLLAPDREHVVAALDAARSSGMAVLELPIGPVLGEATGLLGLPGDTSVPEAWTGPLETVRLIAGAEGVVAASLHAGVVALTQGVPVLRPAAEPDSKYAILDGFEGIHRLGSVDPAEVFGRRAPDPRLAEVSARVGAHWDTVVGIARSGRSAPAPAALRLITRLPARFEASAEQADALAVARARARDYETVAARASELDDELAVARVARAEAEAELVWLRARECTLRRIEGGGWWALRERLAPLMPAASALRRVVLALRDFAERRRA